MRQNPRPNEIYRHFKGNLYQIIALAKHSETMEAEVVYQQLYAPFGVYVRPLEMFMSEVDHVKYPDVEQKYRFEKIQEPFWESKGQTLDSCRPEEAVCLDEDLLAFLDADTYEQKIEILNRMHNTLTDSMIDTMAISLDLEIKEGDIEQRYAELMSSLLKMEHFECNRLR